MAGADETAIQVALEDSASLGDVFDNGQCGSTNVLGDTREKSSKCTATCSTSLSLSQGQPTKRTFLKVKCPGSINGECRNGATKWQCGKCQAFLEFGFDSFIYCGCGRGSVWDYEYICNDSDHHGPTPLRYSEEKKVALDFQLQRLRPFEELNILVLGETGVGKSTWINGFANYLTHKTLDEAEEDELQCPIPASFQLFDENNKEWKITMGVPNENEKMVTGESATQHPTTYVFPYEDSTVRIIDTPGIGDTRGLKQDKENFMRIINHLSKSYKEIHGICILLKPNEARVNIVFEFCIKELLAHLHRDAINNMIFCFTNARATMYRPGNSYGSLQKILQSSARKDGPTIALSPHTVYCMDNEAVRFLAASKNGMNFSMTERACFATSWEKAVDESNRIMEHFKTVKPHKIHDTVSLNQARQSIITMSRPLADISANIQLNIKVLDQREKELQRLKGNEAELRGKLNVPTVVLETVDLDYPRTVCTSQTCVESRKFSSNEAGGSKSMTHYKQVCHEHCYIKGVSTNQVGCVELQGCHCMGPGHRCRYCGCSWERHMHITYETAQKTIQLKCKDTENDLNSTLTTAEEARKVVKECRKRKENLEEEQEIITRASATFAHFLKANSITLYNDATLRYLDQLIRAEEEMVGAGGTRTTLEGLKKTRESHSIEFDILEKVAAKCGSSSVTISDINEIKKQLFLLPIKGAEFKKHFEKAEKSEVIAYKEIHHAPKYNARKSGGEQGTSQKKPFSLRGLTEYFQSFPLFGSQTAPVDCTLHIDNTQHTTHKKETAGFFKW